MFASDSPATSLSKVWKVYLSGEIHSDWRKVIADGVVDKVRIFRLERDTLKKCWHTDTHTPTHARTHAAAMTNEARNWLKKFFYLYFFVKRSVKGPTREIDCTEHFPRGF